jgi:histidyl-tRNA synthetase
MKLNLNALKGFTDYYPEKYLEKNYIVNILNEVSRSFGYLYYDGPIMEESSLYELKSGQSIVEEAYSFIDRGDRMVTLRPEMTPTLGRMLASKSMNYKKPIRWYSIPLIFRNENPQKARQREFSQFNADIIGVSSIISDIEIIDLSMSILRRIGFVNDDFEILVNNRSVAYKILSEYSNDVNSLIKIIDRKSKLPESEFINLVDKNVKNHQYVDKVLEYLNVSGDNIPNEILDFINEASKFGLNLIYDPSIVRGLDYYTGSVFEIWDKKRLIKRSIFGGGRYSDLLSVLGGESLDAVGIGTSVEVLLPLIKEYNKDPQLEVVYDYFISTFDNIDNSIYSNIVHKLRSRGESVILNVNIDWNLKKQLEFSLNIGVKKFIILGEKELKENSLLIKDLKHKTEKRILIADI